MIPNPRGIFVGSVDQIIIKVVPLGPIASWRIEALMMFGASQPEFRLVFLNPVAMYYCAINTYSILHSFS